MFVAEMDATNRASTEVAHIVEVFSVVSIGTISAFEAKAHLFTGAM